MLQEYCSKKIRALAAGVWLAGMCACACAAETHRILIVPQASETPFWKALRDGAEKAAQESSSPESTYVIQWTAPAKPGDALGQAQIVEGASPNEIAGIILSALDRKDLAEAVTHAAGRGIPVLAVEAGVDSASVFSTVGDSNFEAGRMAAECLASAMGGKGNAILLRHHIHAADTEQREQGFLEVMHEEYPSIKLLVTDFHAGPSQAIARRVVPSLIGRYQTELDGIFASSEVAGGEVASELKRRGLEGKVKFVGIEDVGEVLRPALVTGAIQGLVVRNPEAMGREAVREMVEKISGRFVRSEGAPELKLLTGPSVTTSLPNPESGIRIVPSIGLVMVAIHGGKFSMGSGQNERGFRDVDSKPTKVTISREFWLGKFEVTQREWKQVMEGNPSDFASDMNPVDNVSWDQAAEFCLRLNEREESAGGVPKGYAYQLPTEAQWEYACRAATTGPRAGLLDQMGWYVGNSGSWASAPGPGSRAGTTHWQMGTHPVGQKSPNAWGLYDMYGNVLEWCRDWYGPYTGGAVTDPLGSGPSGYRVLRGGGWWTDAGVCFSFSRTKAPPGRHHNALGLRVALAPLQPPPP